MMGEYKSELKLPGFRFHPTEEELLSFYLKSMVYGKKMGGDIIGFLNIYNYEPRDLPGMAKLGEREWYFFVPRDRKHGSGGRPNRTTENGFWKATGSDRRILSNNNNKMLLGFKKTLVFYQGRAPRGRKTHWIMNEYRLPDHKCDINIVLCKIYMKATSLKVLEQRAAMPMPMLSPLQLSTTTSFCNLHQFHDHDDNVNVEEFKREKQEMEMAMVMPAAAAAAAEGRPRSSLVLPNDHNNLPDLQLPKPTMDWTQDSFWSQLSPWLDNFTPFLPMC